MGNLFGCNSSDDVPEEDCQTILILTTSHWHEKWFSQLIIPASRYSNYPKDLIKFMETGGRTFEENFTELRDIILKHEDKLVVLAVTDVVMTLYCTVRESLKREGKYTPPGANFHCFTLATNKLANRKLIPRSATVKSEKVTASMEFLPDLGVKGFFKPLEGVASEGVMVVPVGGETKNPFYQAETGRDECKIIQKLSETIEELEPYIDENIIGLVEEYIPLEDRVSTVSIDGYICNGKINHYTISDNVYQKENPEVFDSLVTPTQRLSKMQQKDCWALYDEVVSQFVERGLDNQFIDVEAFFLKDGRLEVMEVNCRTYSNMLPGFARVYGKNCMVSAALDLLRGKDPGYKNALDSTEGRICVTTYVDCVDGVPDVIEFNDEESGTWGSYYAPPDRSVAHIYSFAKSGEAEMRANCDAILEKVKTSTKRTRG